MPRKAPRQRGYFIFALLLAASLSATAQEVYSIPREAPARDVEVSPAEMEYFTVQGTTLA